MSCPVRKPSSPNLPMVTCHPVGMVVKTTWTPPESKMNININGDWEPLSKILPKCGFSVVEHPDGVVLSIPYTPCLENKDGIYSIGLFGGDGGTKVSCPSWSLPPPPPTQTPPKFSYNPPNPGQPQEHQKFPPSFYTLQPTPPPYSQGEEPLYPYLNIKGKQPYTPPNWNPEATPPVQATKTQPWQSHYPFLFHPQPPKQDVPPTGPKQSVDVVGQTHGLNSNLPGPSEVTPLTPPVSEETLAQIYQPLFHFHPTFAGQSPYQTRVPPTQQITPPLIYQEHKPHPPEHPGGSTIETHENQYFPSDYYFQFGVPLLSQPENLPVALETLVTPQPDAVKSQMEQLRDLYYWDQSENPQPIPIYPAPQIPSLIAHPGDQNPMDSIFSQTSYTEVSLSPQQPNALLLPPGQCPQVCPVGVSNCCPQISFHQHVHHIVPAKNDGKGDTEIKLGSPVVHYGFDYDSDSPPQAQKPKGEPEIQASLVSPPNLHQILPVGMPNRMETPLQPPDGNVAVLPRSHLSSVADSGQVYPHFKGNSHYSYRPVLAQDDLQGPAETFSGQFPKSHPPRYNSIKAGSPYEWNSLVENAPVLPSNTRHVFVPNIMDINKHEKLQPPSYAHRERSMSTPEPEIYPFPHQMFQDAQGPTQRKPSFDQLLSQHINILKKPTKREETDLPHSEPKGYRLLQHGPPGSRIQKSPLPLEEMFGESASPGPQAASQSKNNLLKRPQSELPKWLNKRLSDFDSMPSPGADSEPGLHSDSGGLYSSGPLSQEPLLGTTKLQAEVEPLKDLWEGRRVPDSLPVTSLQRWSSARDTRQTGLNQPIQRKGKLKQQRPGITNK